MSKDDLNRLITEEQAEIQTKGARLWKLLNELKQKVWGLVISWGTARRTGRIDAQPAKRSDQAPPQAPQKPEQCFVGYPIELACCSPFFPLNRSDLSDRKRLDNFTPGAADFGVMTLSGPQLSTYDEDVLLAVLALMEERKYYSGGQRDEDGFTVYRGPILPLARLMGMKQPGKEKYQRIVNALRRMQTAVVTLALSNGCAENDKLSRLVSLAPLLAAAQWDEKELRLALNPFFYESYIAGRVVFLDIKQRMRLTSPIAKALYRFLQSQSDSVFTCQLVTLVTVLNMDNEQPLWKSRQLLKAAIESLVKNQILSADSGFLDGKMIKLHRLPDALPAKKE